VPAPGRPPRWSPALIEPLDVPAARRNLRNLVARLLLFPDQELDLSEAGGAGPAPAVPGGEPDRLLDLPLPAAREQVLERFERRYLSTRLAQHGGNISRAADAMGVSRQLVHRLLDRYGIKAR
jgi:DNA-binding NtrC family response regulator